jgi:hypothetical protein
LQYDCSNLPGHPDGFVLLCEEEDAESTAYLIILLPLALLQAAYFTIKNDRFILYYVKRR